MKANTQIRRFLNIVLGFSMAASTAVFAGAATPVEHTEHAGHGAEQVQPAAAAASENVLTVHKSPTCGCCTGWVDHVNSAGFDTNIHDMADLSGIKQKMGVEPRYQSCHTAVSADGYFFEGHVPADVMKRFLAEKPKNAAGLAVPGMPVGSPGMEMGNRLDPYDVLQINRDGSVEVYASINGNAAP